MSLLRIYLRVLGLLAPEKGLAILLALANLALAGVYFLEPWLFGRVVDALAGAKSAEAWRLILTWHRRFNRFSCRAGPVAVEFLRLG